jgi:hypothetical protein
MEAEKDRERAARIQAKEAELARRREQAAQRTTVRDELAQLYTLNDPWKRGKQLEGVLNRLFALDGVSVRAWPVSLS